MADKTHRGRMVDFTVHRLEEAGKYQIIKRDITHILLAERKDVVENPSTVDILMHNYKRTRAEFNETQAANRAAGIYTAHVFYKDGRGFYVRLARRGRLKDEKSLKNYPKEQIDGMIHLRHLEKSVLDQFSGFPKLVFYQPETMRLEESLRFFDMQMVKLDYSHIGPDDPGYSHLPACGWSPSIDYKIPQEVKRIARGPIEITIGSDQRYKNALLWYESIAKTEIKK